MGKTWFVSVGRAGAMPASSRAWEISCAWAMAGLGVSFNRRLISRKWTGAVAEVPFEEPHYISLGIAVPSLAEASPAAQRFIACIEGLMPRLAALAKAPA